MLLKTPGTKTRRQRLRSRRDQKLALVRRQQHCSSQRALRARSVRPQRGTAAKELDKDIRHRDLEKRMTRETMGGARKMDTKT